jgi:sulfite exporter TauE/SafE
LSSFPRKREARRSGKTRLREKTYPYEPLTLLVAGFGLATAFFFGLLGSVHCFSMCGPLVSLYAGQLSPGAARIAQRQLLLYNLGRVIVYTDLGLLVAIQNPLQAGLLLLSFSLGTVPMLWGMVLLVHGIERFR